MPPARVLLSVVLTQHCPVSSRNSTLNVRLKRGDEEESRNNNNNNKTKWTEGLRKAYLLAEISKEKKGRTLFTILFKYRYLLLFKLRNQKLHIHFS